MEIPGPDIATLRALYKNLRATLFEHQAWRIEFLGFMRFEMTDAPKILPALRDVVKAGVNGERRGPHAPDRARGAARAPGAAAAEASELAGRDTS
jgi:hypothetical protein